MTDQLFGSELQPLDFAGFSLTGTAFRGQFMVQFDIAAQYRPDVVEAEAEGTFPTYVRADPNSKVIPLGVSLIDPGGSTQTLLDALKSAFSPSRDIDYLRVLDANGNTRRMRAKSLGLAPYLGDDQYIYVASLEAPEPIWESDTVSEIFYNVSGNAAVTTKTWSVTNSGNEECYPVVTVTPYSARAGSLTDWQMPIVIAWRSSLEGVDSQGLPYPINLTDGLWNTVGLADYTEAGVRAWLDGVEINRYITHSGTTGTSVWASVPFQPARTATLAANITGSATSMTVTSPDDLAAFPDVGFLLVDSECIAYRGKSLTGFLALKRGQRGTSIAGLHSAAATIYWVEHDIRLSWGQYSNVVASGLSLADEKPIIDIGASTNLHHKYGTTDGLIEPESLRSGQWVRELRALASSPRAPYCSLGQGSGIVEIADALPVAGAPNFDSLSLYSPCFVSSNVTGVALDVAVDHMMACDLYGVDTEGFETLMHRRDALGYVPFYGEDDGVARAESMAGDAPFYSRTFLPPSDLARITLQGFSGAVTGAWDNGDDLTAATNWGGNMSGTYGAQILNIETPREIRTITFEVFTWATFPSAFKYEDWVSGAWFTNISCYIATDDDPFFQAVNTVNIPSDTDMPPTTANFTTPAFAPVTVEFGSDAGSGEIFVWRGKVAVAFQKTTSVAQGGYRVRYSTVSRYLGGAYWTGRAGVDTEEPYSDAFAVVSDATGKPQTDATLGTGFKVQLKNVDVHFNPSYTPLIVRGAVAGCYTLLANLLTNNTTGESITVNGILPLDSVQADDIFKIDADGHVITVLTDAPTDYEQPAGYAIDPSDIQHWMRLVPGANSITFSNLGQGPRLICKMYFRPKWT